jgi:hypothetical protein
MITIAQLLELLYGARRRFQSVRATLSVEVDHSLLERSDWPDDAVNPPPPRTEPQAYVARLWADSAGRIRLEREVDRELDIEVIGGHDGQDEAESLAEGLFDLFDPAPLLGSASFELRGELTQAGRPAASVLAQPRRQPIEIGYLWGCEAYELAVDLERGVLLHVVGRIGGEAAGTIAVEEIAFDEPLAPELFEQEPQKSDDATVEEHEPTRTETVSLRTAAERAPFTLWVVARLLDEWRMYVRLVEEEPPGPEPAWVEILYRSHDGANRVELIEERTREAFGYGWTSSQAPPRLIEHRGEQVLVVAQEPYETELAVTRGETRIRLRAIDPLEATLNLVDALTPVRVAH